MSSMKQVLWVIKAMGRDRWGLEPKKFCIFSMVDEMSKPFINDSVHDTYVFT